MPISNLRRAHFEFDLGEYQQADHEHLAAALDALDHYAIGDGLPVVINAMGEIDWPVTDFAAMLQRRQRSARTTETYTRELEVFGRYLAARRGRALVDATEEDFWAYRRFRLDGPIGIRLADSTWNKVAAALLKAKTYLKLPGEISWKEFRAGRGERGGQVRMIGVDQFIAFRDLGMGTSPRSPLRNVAFAELLVTTGMRCTEASSLLLRELPPLSSFREHRMVELQLPAMITKGRVRRSVHYSRRIASDPIRSYIDEERAHRAARLIEAIFGLSTYSLKQLDELSNWIFLEHHGDRVRLAGGIAHGSVRSRDSFSLEERPRLVEVRPAQATGRFEIVDFGALWLSERGPIPSRAAWNATFTEACNRAGGTDALGRRVTPHTLRHTFAVRQLHNLIVGLVDMRARLPLTGKRGDLYEMTIGDPLRIVQHLLGHAQLSTTRKYLEYIEDNTALVQQAVALWDRDLG